MVIHTVFFECHLMEPTNNCLAGTMQLGWERVRLGRSGPRPRGPPDTRKPVHCLARSFAPVFGARRTEQHPRRLRSPFIPTAYLRLSTLVEIRQWAESVLLLKKDMILTSGAILSATVIASVGQRLHLFRFPQGSLFRCR